MVCDGFCQHRRTIRIPEEHVPDVRVYLFEEKHKHFRRLFALFHSLHETRLLVLSGFTLTVIHMNVSSRNPKNTRKEITFTNWRRCRRATSSISKFFQNEESYVPATDIAWLINHFILKMIVVSIEANVWQRKMYFLVICVPMKFNAAETNDNVLHRLISRALAPHILLITQRRNIDMLEMLIIGNKKA